MIFLILIDPISTLRVDLSAINADKSTRAGISHLFCKAGINGSNEMMNVSPPATVINVTGSSEAMDREGKEFAKIRLNLRSRQY